ncbi:MAG: substrate-binding domain-containing protein [Myxococcota bacterium]
MAFRALLPILVGLLWAHGLAAEEIVVVVHPSRVVSLDATDIAQIFLKQRRFWGDGDAIVPVNRDAGSPAREAFSRAIFRDDSRSQVAYWNRAYFGGVLPPITLASDEAVVRFVASDPRAIGYVEASRANESVRIAARLSGRRDD